MLCPGCNKFASYSDDADIEMSGNEEIADDGSFAFDVELSLNSECCGEALKSTSFSFEGCVPDEIIEVHTGDGHELSIEIDEPEYFTDTDPATKTVTLKNGQTRTRNIPYRFRKTYHGVQTNVTVSCSCSKEAIYDEAFSDKCAASYMDEC